MNSMKKRPPRYVVLVSEEDHTCNCPKCGRLLHAEKIYMDDPFCYLCGERFKIEISAPNDEV
jgi:transcription elongation factor Elf1